MPRERTCLAEDYVAITLLSCLDKAGANEGREDPALPGVRRAKPFHAAPYDFKEWQKFLVQQQRGKQAAMGRCPNEHLRTNRPGEQIIPGFAHLLGLQQEKQTLLRWAPRARTEPAVGRCSPGAGLHGTTELGARLAFSSFFFF